MNDVGILIVDDDATSQRALQHILDSEGWRVKIVTSASEALSELATGAWNLAIVNTALAEVRGPLFAILRELSRVEPPDPDSDSETPRKIFRALFLVPILEAPRLQPLLEDEGLPYSLKPYHLNEFLEKVSDLLQEAGAIAQPVRGMGGFTRLTRVSRGSRSSREPQGASMFASRDAYQMTEEEIAEFERQEEAERKKREKKKKDQERLF